MFLDIVGVITTSKSSIFTTFLGGGAPGALVSTFSLSVLSELMNYYKPPGWSRLFTKVDIVRSSTLM